MGGSSLLRRLGCPVVLLRLRMCDRYRSLLLLGRCTWWRKCGGAGGGGDGGCLALSAASLLGERCCCEI